ncbi:hypothetical protein [Cellulomonas sp.]|uniref:hypothetical protein n=1 Tax=Cellulomonas sp. TaxID=40001 RepID=UPI00258F94A3|nr:hypothetical protein [Cellulomonas sp.]MCR6688691.1 hypothetical protein [Cellulomonas sp.]
MPDPAAPDPAGPGPGAPAAARRWPFVLGGVGALVVAAVFATVGDGVDVPEANGLRGAVVEHAHTVTWALLAAALLNAARRPGWDRLSQTLAVAGGASYAGFLAAVFVL